jgi:DNA helicase-2/ATP-dependent DNA helicase PcrA
MILTSEQRKAVKHNGHTLLTACPGSGKTHTLAAKLIDCIDEVRGTPRRIACITYTNPAVYEIEDRLKSYGSTGDEDSCDISTIHSFCLVNILQNFYWHIPEYSKGFKVLPPDSERYRELVESVCGEYNILPQFRGSFENLGREPDGSPVEMQEINSDAIMAFWNMLLKEGYIDFPNIIYYTYRLMLERPEIAHALACRYAWFLVDEFQDTSALQVEILKLVSEKKITKFFLVGDPYQSIYGFAGAHPALMDDFASHIQAERGFNLFTNFRSSKPIIYHAENLCPRNPHMIAGGKSTHFSEEPKYIHCNNAFEAITDYFLPAIDELKISYGESAILAPWWIKLLQVGRRLRDYGVPIVGPGARPYRRAHLFAMLAEQVCAYIEQPNPKIFYNIERELFLLINNITGSADFKVYTYAGRVVVMQLINCGIEIKEKYENGIVWLREASQSFSEILMSAGFLAISGSVLIKESVKGMELDMEANGIDTNNLSIADLGMFAHSDRSMKLLTMHRAKGREFDAVAIIDLHEGKVPHFSATTNERIEESKRLLYVSITRARRLLMYITDEERPQNRPSRFLGLEGLGLLS